MNFGQMKTKVRRKLNDNGVTFFTDDDIEDAINEGYEEMADATEFFEREAMIPMIEGHTYYNLLWNLPDMFLSPRRGQNTTTTKWLDPATPLELDRSRQQWELTQGEPERAWLRGNWWYGVYPKPTQDSPGIRFYYTSIPAAMTDSTDEPEFPEEFSEGLIAYALCDLFSQTGYCRLP